MNELYQSAALVFVGLTLGLALLVAVAFVISAVNRSNGIDE